MGGGGGGGGGALRKFLIQIMDGDYISCLVELAIASLMSININSRI